ncbi:hypothetical protein DXB79_08400 [Bacteroides fragilis]|jgi:hypothetical protein|nr:hypothetical protein F9003_02110 [Bacteroides fragilis]RGM89464.1 hypothetical protein DXB89_00410 [Bacteroides fragilis]RGN15297.1 hypothetical protein DXB79_08400 [Bacteroides fragilis]RHI90056.1 hypothetical protein DW148_24145 [Bacteroides fragilis]TWV54343.1 hypothetical protein FSA01_02100 [Bacteroides fragilis]
MTVAFPSIPVVVIRRSINGDFFLQTPFSRKMFLNSYETVVYRRRERVVRIV